MSIKTARKKKEIDLSKVKQVGDAEHQQVIDLLKGRCLEVSYSTHGLPKTRRIKGKMAQAISESVKGTTKGIRGSWSTFTSAHPAVAEFNAAVRELDKLRDTWTIVRSAEAKKGEGNTVNIEGGVRLIWDHDVDEFYKLFSTKARAIDAAVSRIQHFMDAPMVVTDPESGEDATYDSIKDMDRAEAGQCWDESVYPKDVRVTAGVARERDADGSAVLDDDGQPKYIIKFEEYHVSEKLPELLRTRAMERLDAKMSDTVETAFGYAVAELNEDLSTFMAELVNRQRIYPKAGPYLDKYCQVEKAEVIKVVDHDRDSTIPAGSVRVLLGYKTVPEGSDEKRPVVVREWVGPMTVDQYHVQLRPQATGEKKKIYAGVVEGIIAKMEAFRDKKAKMLGTYGENALAAFESLWGELTKFKGYSTTNDVAAQKLVSKLKTSVEAKEEVGAMIADTIAALEDQCEVVKQSVRRRKISAKLVGKVGDDE